MKLITALLLILSCYISTAFSGSINVDLSLYRPDDKNFSTFTHTYHLVEDQNRIDITNINPSVGFLVIQVHSYVENVTLSESPNFQTRKYVTGTNIGLVWAEQLNWATLYLLRNIKVQATVNILLVINLYDEIDPVPGGCNLTFDTVIAPYQKVTYTDDYIMVHSQPPSAYGTDCDYVSKMQVDMYHIFLPEYDNKNDTYFSAISRMLTVDQIKANGKKVTNMEGHFKYGRLYSSYRGTGEVFAVIATHNNRSSAYVPAVSYGCDLLNWETNCVGPISDEWKFLCAFLLIFGLFVCFMGHKFFRICLFLMGVTFGIFVTYLIISMQGDFTVTDRGITSLVVGILYGLGWVFIWWKFGLPLLSAHLAFLLSGILIASTVFYGGLADVYFYINDINFWVTFISIVIICLLLASPATKYGHIVACSLLGSYAAITALNYYVGGNLQYIIINTYRRVTVRNFRIAVIDPPFQTIDIFHSLLWATLCLFGCYIQIRDQRNRPPFPPNRNRVETPVAENTETTPLLYPSVPPPEYV